MARRRHDIRLMVLCGTLVAVLWWSRLGPPAPREGVIAVGQPAPAFSLPIVAGPGAAEGDRLSLAALRGNPVLLEFWASWCGVCMRSLPGVVSQVAAAREHEVLLVGVNVEALEPQAVQALLGRLGVSMSSVQDAEMRTQLAYGVDALPTSVLVGADGRVLQVHRGALDSAMLAGWLADLPRVDDLDAPGVDR